MKNGKTYKDMKDDIWLVHLGEYIVKYIKKFQSQVLVTMVICELCFLTDREVVQNE